MLLAPAEPVKSHFTPSASRIRGMDAASKMTTPRPGLHFNETSPPYSDLLPIKLKFGRTQTLSCSPHVEPKMPRNSSGEQLRA